MITLPAEALFAGAICLWALGGLAWWLNKCRCDKCAFHRNEDRMARLKKKEESDANLAREKALRHDVAHKGWGWATGDPDTLNCDDKDCLRNKASRIET